MLNKVFLIGHVGADPDVNYVREDMPVAKFGLATSESYVTRDGSRVDNTEWHNIVVWRGLAKVVERYVKKGSKLYIEGKISTRKYEKDGITKYFTEIIARELKMLDSRQSQGDNPQNNYSRNNQTSNTRQNPVKPVVQTPVVKTQEKKQIVNNDPAPTHSNSDFDDFNDVDDLPF